MSVMLRRRGLLGSLQSRPAFIGAVSTSKAGGSGSTLTVNLPASAVAGDLVVVAVTSGDASTLSGLTSAVVHIQRNTNRQYIVTGIVPSGATSFTVTNSFSTTGVIDANVAVYRGGVIHGTVYTQETVSNTQFVMPGITVATSGARVVAVCDSNSALTSATTFDQQRTRTGGRSIDDEAHATGATGSITYSTNPIFASHVGVIFELAGA